MVTPGRWIRAVLGLVGYAALVFAPAGTMAWPQGWCFFALLVGFAVVAFVVLLRDDTGLLEERSAGMFRPGQPVWDRVWLVALWPTYVLWIVSAGIDAVRFGWTSMPWWLHVFGAAAVALGLALVLVVFRANPFASAATRIQADRGHRVIDSGPYAVVRHPMYSAMVLLFPGGSLLLGSTVSLVFAVLVCVLLAVRIPLEESVLRRDLPGYEAYRARVRHRLIPGVW
jgi:protein-S-isoprenylcysteine O-methyltransferase Ste14